MSLFTPNNTETKHPSIAIKQEEDEEEEEEDDFAPTTSQCVESAVTKVTRTVTRTPPVHIHKGDLPNLDHWEYPKSDFDCLFVSFQHAQSILFEAGTYQEREDSLFPETAPLVERKAPPCARASKCVATRQPFPLVEEPRHRGQFVLMAMPRPDEKVEDGQGRLCFLCHLEVSLVVKPWSLSFRRV